MNPERWRQIENLYHAALEHEPKDRGKFIAEACEGNTGIRRELCLPVRVRAKGSWKGPR
jgi:hypothetical protein